MLIADWLAMPIADWFTMLIAGWLAMLIAGWLSMLIADWFTIPIASWLTMLIADWLTIPIAGWLAMLIGSLCQLVTHTLPASSDDGEVNLLGFSAISSTAPPRSTASFSVTDGIPSPKPEPQSPHVSAVATADMMVVEEDAPSVERP